MSRFLLLLFALLALVLLYPTIGGGTVRLVILDTAGFAVLLAGLYAVTASRRIFWIAAVVGVLGFASGLLGRFIMSEPLAFVSHPLRVCFFVLIAYTLLADVCYSGPVTSDRILGAICSFLLFGIAWAFIYPLVDLAQPGSFSVSASAAATLPDGAVMVAPPMVYYSFVTLTTLGYGDIVPVSPLARTLSWLEAVFGQIFLAVVIARLVGLHIAEAFRGRS